MAKLDFEALNATIRYVMFSAFAVRPGVLGYDEESRAAVIDEISTIRPSCRSRAPLAISRRAASRHTR